MRREVLHPQDAAHHRVQRRLAVLGAVDAHAQTLELADVVDGRLELLEEGVEAGHVVIGDDVVVLELHRLAELAERLLVVALAIELLAVVEQGLELAACGRRGAPRRHGGQG